MKSVLDQLPYKDKQLLISFYQSDSYKAFRNLIDLERLALAKDAIDRTDILEVRFLSGQALGLKRLVGTLKELNAEAIKNEEKKNRK